MESLARPMPLQQKQADQWHLRQDRASAIHRPRQETSPHQRNHAFILQLPADMIRA